MSLYLMGMNLSDRQIVHALDLNDNDVQETASLLQTISPLIRTTTTPASTVVHTHKYNIYERLTHWDTNIKRFVIVGASTRAMRMATGSFHEMHVNTMERFWSLLRSWRRPHRGIS
jgi:hypothetical protein